MKKYKEGWNDALLWVLEKIEENPNAKLSHIGYIIEKDLEKEPKEEEDNSQSFFDFNQLKAFDKVLVRHGKHGVWAPAFFHSYRPQIRYSPFYTIESSNGGFSFAQCVPYEGNEYLMETIQDAKPYYKFETFH